MATLLAAVGEYERALDYAAQAQVLAQAINERLIYAAVHMISGHGLAGLARWEEAAAVYRQSYNLLRAIDRPSFGIETLAGLARISLAQGDVAAALEHIEQILAELAVEDREYYEEPLRIDLTCYQVLRAANDPRAYAVLERAHAQLQEQAARITDEAMRHAFLHNVPYHREIAAAWAEMHGDE